jgi:hypothetical protein
VAALSFSVSSGLFCQQAFYLMQIAAVRVQIPAIAEQSELTALKIA